MRAVSVKAGSYPNTVASYRYDAFGQLTDASENFGGTTTWTNPYRYDGRDEVRYDGETGLYWMSVRAYDPALGRFLSRDPLGRAPLFFSDQPYVYAGNNPLINVDPSGQRIMAEEAIHQVHPAKKLKERKYRVAPYHGKIVGLAKPSTTSCDRGDSNCIQCHGDGQCRAKKTAYDGFSQFQRLAIVAAAVGFFADNVLGPAAKSLIALGFELELLALSFSDESTNDVSWFTSKHVSDFAEQVNGILLAITAVAFLASQVLLVVAALTAEAPPFAVAAGIAAGAAYLYAWLNIGVEILAYRNLALQQQYVD